MPAKAGQTALSGSQIKPPALPEVHDFLFPDADSDINTFRQLRQVW